MTTANVTSLFVLLNFSLRDCSGEQNLHGTYWLQWRDKTRGAGGGFNCISCAYLMRGSSPNHLCSKAASQAVAGLCGRLAPGATLHLELTERLERHQAHPGSFLAWESRLVSVPKIHFPWERTFCPDYSCLHLCKSKVERKPEEKQSDVRLSSPELPAAFSPSVIPYQRHHLHFPALCCNFP